MVGGRGQWYGKINLTTQADRADGKKKGWWWRPKGLRSVHEAVIIAALGFIIGTLAAGALYFTP